jgi:hypothetical protein
MGSMQEPSAGEATMMGRCRHDQDGAKRLPRSRKIRCQAAAWAINLPSRTCTRRFVRLYLLPQGLTALILWWVRTLRESLGEALPDLAVFSQALDGCGAHTRRCGLRNAGHPFSAVARSWFAIVWCHLLCCGGKLGRAPAPFLLRKPSQMRGFPGIKPMRERDPLSGEASLQRCSISALRTQ